jgi:transposase
MILPPRPENHRRLDPARPRIDLFVTSVPLPPRDYPHLDRFAVPPWDRQSPQRLAIDDDLPADHLARAIDEAVDRLDLTDLFASYAGVGSRPYRPDLMLKIVLYEIQTGRHSPGQWAEDARDRRCLLWLGRGIQPSRSRCYAFRDRLGARLGDWNRQVLQAAVAQGLTTAKSGSLDGTLIAAEASRHRLLNLARLDRRLEELDRAIAADLAGQDPGAVPGWMARSPATRRRQRHRFQEARRALRKEHARNARRPGDRRQEPDQIVISTGDPEAALGRDKEKVFRPLYNFQVVQDTESPLVLGYEVFAQATDAGTLMPLRRRAHELTGAWLKEVLADTGYASALDLVDCARAGVELYAPYQENDWTERRRARRPRRQIPKGEFTWRAEEQVYVCPRGQRLERISREARERADGRTVGLTTYRCAQEHCRACPLKSRCTSGAKGRTIKRNEHEELIEAHRAKMETPEAKAIYRKRCQTVELRFADTKEHRDLRRFSGRGLERVRIEAGLCVLAHNLLAVRALERRRAAEGHVENPCENAA